MILVMFYTMKVGATITGKTGWAQKKEGLQSLPIKY
jgi:hypothetical protein